jgi:hypothetical protein
LDGFTGFFMDEFFGFEHLHGADEFFLEKVDVEGFGVFEVER